MGLVGWGLRINGGVWSYHYHRSSREAGNIYWVLFITFDYCFDLLSSLNRCSLASSLELALLNFSERAHQMVRPALNLNFANFNYQSDFEYRTVPLGYGYRVV